MMVVVTTEDEHGKDAQPSLPEHDMTDPATGLQSNCRWWRGRGRTKEAAFKAAQDFRAQWLAEQAGIV